VEDVTADVLSRMNAGGALFIWPAFFNSWDGDHVEKNSGYWPYYFRMLHEVGYHKVGGADDVFQVVRDRAIHAGIQEERELLRRQLYALSANLSLRAATNALVRLPDRLARRFLSNRKPLSEAFGEAVSPLIDNVGIWRLSTHRLREIAAYDQHVSRGG